MRLYRAGLRLYPPAFRARFAVDLADAVEDNLRARWESGGAWTVVSAFPAMARDLLSESARARLVDRAPGHASSFSPRRPQESPPRTAQRMFTSLREDAFFAIRSLRRAPGFSVVVIATLALGIGATTAVFTAVNAIALRPLPYPDAHELAMIWQTDAESPTTRGAVGGVNATDWASMNTTLTGIGLHRSWRTTLSGVDLPTSLVGGRVSFEYTDILRLRALYGRPFQPEDDAIGAPDRVMLGYEMWRDVFGAARDVIGRSITLDGTEWEVIGVLEPGFVMPRYSATTQVLSMLRLDLSESSRGSYNLRALTRIRPGVTFEEASADLIRVSEILEADYPDTNRGVRAWVRPLHADTIADVQVSLYALLAAGTFVMLVAIANVAGLLVARTTTREEELAVRAALGAGRGRILRLLVTETMLLAVLGGAAGMVLAEWGTRVLVALAPASVPRLDEVRVDLWTVLFALGATVVAGSLCGLAAAWRRGPAASGLRSTRGNTAQGAERIRTFLVSAQVAVALVLMVGAGLLIASFANLLAEDPGMDPAGILAARLALSDEYAGSEAQQAFFSNLLESIEARPEVDVAGSVFLMPFAGGSVGGSFGLPGRPEPGPDEDDPSAYVQAVSASYFDLLRTEMARGRGFVDSDDWAGERVAIINEAAARQFWPDSDPIGDRLQLFIRLDDQERDLERTIVGVVRDSRQWSLDRDPEPFIYVPFEQYPVSSMYVMARTHGDPAGFTSTLREIVREADAELALYRVGTLDSFLDRTLEQQRFSMALLTGFAAVALVLGCVGIYGLIAFSVARRTREIGLRMALGATGQRVLGLVLAQTSRMVLAGVVVGVGVSLLLTRYIDSLLHEVSATDPLTLAAVTGLLVAFSLVAGLIPARRASAVDPAVALRSD